MAEQDFCERCEKRTCEPGDDGRWLCERCRAKADHEAWYEDQERQIEAVAAEYGWTVDLDSIAETGSRYYSIYRECRGEDQTEQDVEDYGPTGLEKITVRISDHGDCYCRSDYSVAMRPSGNDVTLETVLCRLRRPAK